MLRASTGALMLLLATEPQDRWLRLSNTDQGYRYVDFASATRVGDHAYVDTELRMRPVLKRREHFQCSRRRMQVDMFAPANAHDPTSHPVGKIWTSIEDVLDGPAMFRIACLGRR